MKVLVILALVAAAYAEIAPAIGDDQFSLIETYVIPLGEKIRAAEEQQMTQGRIVGGSPSRLGQFPYQAGLLARYLNHSGTGVCGGSLVTANRVITAAHCWWDGKHQAWTFTVVLGSVTLFTGGTRLDTSVIAVHPQWSHRLIRNDVAVIYLPTSVAFSATISPVALPSGIELTQDYVGASAVASGFGLTATDGSITQSQVLSHVTLNVITNNICRFAFPFVLQSSNICTSGIGGTSTCSGDSGGPLTVQSNGRPILIGITSFGSAFGCQIGLPAVFARTSSFITFINQHLA